MNPEEGKLRPQMMDRFGLRVLVRGLDAVDHPDEILEAYRRVRIYHSNPRRIAAAYTPDTMLAQDEIQAARDLLPKVCLTDEVAQQGLKLVSELQLDSLRACVTLFEAARAYAVLDGRETVNLEDLAAVAPMALRLRRSPFMAEFFSGQAKEEQELKEALVRVLPK